jgi:iturin family lipopeptide synthetase A
MKYPPLAYVMKTSGTTSINGTLVRVPFSTLNSNLNSIRKRLQLDQSVVGIQVSSITFDPHLIELLLPLCVGGSVVILSFRKVRDPNLLFHELCHHKVTLFMCTPSLFKSFTDSQITFLCTNSSIRNILLGGEQFPDSLLNLSTTCKIWNIYGTTESSVWATLSEITDDCVPNISAPLEGVDLYIEGKPLSSFPLNQCVYGELSIGGEDRLCFVDTEIEKILYDDDFNL